MRSLLSAISLALACAALLGCGEDTSPVGQSYDVTIRRTTYGIPHIQANDLASLGYGVGYAAGQDYGCYLADQIVKVRSQRAATFGRGDMDANVDSDFAYLQLGVHAKAEAELSQQPKDVQDLIQGYVDGYDRWLADTGVDNLPEPCKGAAWVTPITAVDLQAYALDLALRGSSVAFLSYLSNAAPPNATKQKSAPRSDRFGVDLSRWNFESNGWGIGAEKSASGGGILLANPHFQWEGEIHWHEAHLTIPGQLDVYGVSILGSPVIQIGFNQHVAWTHTVTPSQHMTLYRLALDPNDPTSYLVDGEKHAMTSQDFTIQVQESDGSMSSETRTMWRSDYGSMVAGPGVDWTKTTAYSVRDANEDDERIIEQWYRIDQAASVAEIATALADVHADPWVYTIAADDGGDALLIDAARVPNVSKATEDAFAKAVASDPITKVLAENGVSLLDGSTSRDAWIPSSEPGADGLVPVASAPQLTRRDFVMNANDAPWATNPAQPITGYSFLYGGVFTPLIPRSRMNLEMLTERGKFTPGDVEDDFWSERAIVAEQLLADVVARCQGAPPVNVSGKTIDVGPACDALAGWDGRYDLDRRGAVVWRELLGQLQFSDVEDKGALYANAFDPKEPIHTPSGLVAKPESGQDPILVLLAKGVMDLEAAGFSVDSTLGELQFTMKQSDRIPIPGGQDLEGAMNVVSYYGKGNLDTSLLPEPKLGALVDANTDLTKDGYLCDKGSSFVMVADMESSGPKVRAILSTSESRDPSSPHYEDQTKLFATKTLREVLFDEASIEADPNLESKELMAPR